MITHDSIKMGKMPNIWKEGTAKSITFSVTEDCNLACRYCYMTGKNTKNKMSFEVAKKTVDYFLSNRDIFNEESVVWDFIGGEPFLEIGLIDQICDYIKLQMYLLDHPWFNSYRFSFSTNGLLYDTPEVQKYIHKNSKHLSIGISIDGNKTKHDMQRVRLDGSGSYDDVMKNARLWMHQFPEASTKSTFSHDDLPYLKDSVISLWENGIKMIAANVVFEDVWYEGDDIIFENQLRELADYIIEKRIWEDHSVRFFDPHIGFPITEEERNKNFCGAGKMIAIDYKGDLFPCVRFLDFSLNNKPGIIVGNIDAGIDLDKVRPFLGLTLKSQSTEECLNCDVASGCSWCTGFNYDTSDSGTIYQRATFICKMHKANVRACEYFWKRFEEATGLVSPREISRTETARINGSSASSKYLQFITSDNITPHCSYRNLTNSNNVMYDDLVEKGLKFASENNLIPVFLGESKGRKPSHFQITDTHSHNSDENTILICDNTTHLPESFNGTCILLLSRNNLAKLSQLVTSMYTATNRVNLVLEDIEKWDTEDIKLYESELDKLIEFIAATYDNSNALELNVITDILNLDKMCNCDCGNSTYSLAPNGKIYLCPAFYFNNPDESIGDLEKGIDIENAYLLDIENASICSTCDAYHCKRCKYTNKKLTNEINTPSRVQCTLSHIERNKSMKLQKELQYKGNTDFINYVNEIDYVDPLDKLLQKTRRNKCV